MSEININDIYKELDPRTKELLKDIIIGIGADGSYYRMLC